MASGRISLLSWVCSSLLTPSVFLPSLASGAASAAVRFLVVSLFFAADNNDSGFCCCLEEDVEGEEVAARCWVVVVVLTRCFSEADLEGGGWPLLEVDLLSLRRRNGFRIVIDAGVGL